ncbi:MAG: carboxypeptidase regulatory-like domain-containing protein [Terracidiphilus sp.]
MNSSRSWISFLVEPLRILAVILFAATPAFPQVSTANVSGEVEDTSGARLPSVAIKLLNLQTGNENAATTDAAGAFLIPGVLPGLYSMQVQRDGFAAVHLTGLSLSVGDWRQFLIKLRLSTVEQTVEVDASGQSLNTEDAQMTTVVDSLLVRELPLNGRSFQDLIAMTPGSVSVSPQMPRTGGFSVNGQSPDTNTYWVDGISANFGSGTLDADRKVPAAGQYASVTSLGTTHGLVALDALQEFRVVASTASAEYGSAPGGQFSLLTKQGTDHIRATAYAYLRNGYFDATDWFGRYLGEENNLYYYQQDIGGSLGMPLIFGRQRAIPSRTQFFGSYEEMHVQQRTAPLVLYVPNAFLICHAPAQVQSAFQTLPQETYGTVHSSCDDFSGPELLEDNGVEPSPPSFLKSMDIRVDHTLGANLTGFLRFGNTPSGSQDSLLLTTTNARLSNQSLTLGLDGQVSSQAGNEFRLGWARADSSSLSSIQTPTPFWAPADLPAALGSPGAPNDTRSELYMRIAGIGDTSAWTDGGTNALRQLELRDTFSLQRGPHLIRFGIDARNLHSAVRPLPWTIEADFLSADSILANSADFLILRRNESAHPIFEQFAAFMQDQWRVARNFTVSPGMRWDVTPPPSSSDGRDAFRVNGDPDSPATLQVSPRGTRLWQTDWWGFGPRIGIAWQPGREAGDEPGHELILRGGLGVVLDTPNRAAAPAFTALGFTSTSVLQNASIPTTAAAPLSPDAPNAESLEYIFPQALRDPYSLQWNVSLERAAGKHESIVVSYVGAAGLDLLLPQRRQIVSPMTPLQEVVTFPSGFSSRFDSFQLVYRGQYRSRLAWTTSYVWGHTLDFGNPNPWAAPVRGSAETDVRHNLQAAFSWSLPEEEGSKLVHNALSGWGVDGRFFVRSAYPVDVLGNQFHDPVTGEQFYTGANLIPGKPLYLSNHSLPGGRMLNGGPNIANGAFQIPAGNAEGDAPRNIARGFGAQQLSLSLRRDIHLYDRLFLQVRGDVFNVSNSPDFGYIVPNLNDQLFGQPTLSLNQSYGQSGSLYQPGGPRSLQWMFRIRW